jgi:very-short-patch-repair endonuclease
VSGGERRRILGASEGLVAGAKELRHRLTAAEQVLWSALRGRGIGGLRFRRQHPVGPFVLDFFCPAAKLVIEVDGPIHEQQREQDQARTEHLEAYGYRVLRFTNQEVMTNLEAVVAQIADVASGLPPEQRDRRSSEQRRAETVHLPQS